MAHRIKRQKSMKLSLTIESLKNEAKSFSRTESHHKEPSLFGVNDGKAVGTYLEHKFQDYLAIRYRYSKGSSAKGIDFPDLCVDIKVTSIRQPQSSCPFKSARQKIYGLGYSLLVFVYDKKDDRKKRTATLVINHVIYIDSSRTADFQTTSGILRILETAGNADDLVAFMSERSLPLDDIQARILAEEILRKKPAVGYLTISNALQWRLQYSRAIEKAGMIGGVSRII